MYFGRWVFKYYRARLVQVLWKTVWQFVTKLNTGFPYNSAIAILYLYPNEWKTYVYTNLHMNVYSNFIDNYQKLDATKVSFSR